jgi:Family of unknown function (DUF6049)
MLKRAGGGLAAAVVLAGLALPGAVLTAAPATAAPGTAAAQQASSAATTQQTGSAQQTDSAEKATAGPVSVAITGMSPTWAGPGTTVSVTGLVTNVSRQRLGRLTVQLLGSSTPVSSLAEIAGNSAQTYGLASTIVPRASWRSGRKLAPGATVKWSITLRTRALGMTTFGVYPIAAQVQDSFGNPLALATTYLPYMPPKKGPYHGSRPAPQQIAWVWPLIDKPLLNEPWQRDCQGAQAHALARSLAPGGRLNELLAAAAGPAGNPEAWASQAAQGRAARNDPAQSLAGLDGVTWAVDPALLANVKALTTCSAIAPGMARAASAWLGQLRAATASQPVFATPYADVDVAALIMHPRRATDARLAFQLGREVASSVLHRNLTPSATGGTAPGAAEQVTGIAWPADGIDYATVENLAGSDAIGTIVLGSSALPAETRSVVRMRDGALNRYVTVLLSNDSLAQLIQSATSAPGSAFTTAQQFLAETAVLAEQSPAQPIVVAPPQRWQPPADLAADLLADTATAPWLSPVSLTGLTAAKSIPTVQPPAAAIGPPSYSRAELRQLALVDGAIRQLQSIQLRKNNYMFLGLATVESSAWQGKASGVATSMLRTLASTVAAQQRDLQIIVDSRVTLGGLKGSVPVSIDNGLGFAIRIGVQLFYSKAGGVQIHPDPPLVVVGPGRDRTIRLKVQAVRVGSTTVTVRLISPTGQTLPVRARRMTIEATQVGILGMIIFAGALGVFLIASAARAVRRGRAPPPADQAAAGMQATDEPNEGSGAATRPDTVVPAHSDRGTAGTPGL